MHARALGLLLVMSCGGAASPDPALAIHLRREASFAEPIDDLVVRVEVGDQVFEHSASPTEAFESSGDVVLFFPGALRGTCVVRATALLGGDEVGDGAAEASLGFDEDVVIEVGLPGEAGCCQSAADDGLRGWWRFEELSGKAADASELGNDAVAVGEPIRGQPGVIGHGVELSGGDHLVVSDSASLDLAGDMTIEAWIRPDLLSGDCGTSGNAIVAKWHVSPQGQYQLATCSSGQIRFLLSEGARATVLNSRTTLVRGETVHVAARLAGDLATVFLNGTVDAEISAPAPAVFEYDRDDVYLGGAGMPGWSFEGMIDEVKIWGVARSDQDICRDAGGEPFQTDCDLEEVLP